MEKDRGMGGAPDSIPRGQWLNWDGKERPCSLTNTTGKKSSIIH